MVDISSTTLVDESSRSTKVSLNNPEILVRNSNLRPTVLAKLKDETASRVTHTSIDHASYPQVAIDLNLTSKLFTSNQNSEVLYFVHGISASDVQAHGEHIAACCKEESPLFATFFFRRRGVSGVFPAEFRRLVTTLAYQICVAPSCPQELRVEILGALYMEPDIPEQTLYNQFQKLLVSPLQKFPPSPLSTPIIIVLDSIHNCEDVKHVITPIARVVNELSMDGINLKFVITSVSYRYVLHTLQKQEIAPLTHNHPIPSSSYMQQVTFFARNWRYELPDLAQRFVTVVFYFALWIFSPSFLSWILAVVGFPPVLAIMLGYAAVLLPTAILMIYWMVSYQARMYREAGRLLRSRD